MIGIDFPFYTKSIVNVHGLIQLTTPFNGLLHERQAKDTYNLIYTKSQREGHSWRGGGARNLT